MAGCGRDPDDRKVDRILESGPPKKRRRTHTHTHTHTQNSPTRPYSSNCLPVRHCISKKIYFITGCCFCRKYLHFKRNCLSETLYILFRKLKEKIFSRIFVIPFLTWSSLSLFYIVLIAKLIYNINQNNTL